MRDVSAVTVRMEQEQHSLRVNERINWLKQKKNPEYILSVKHYFEISRTSNMETGRAERQHDIGVHIHADVNITKPLDELVLLTGSCRHHPPQVSRGPLVHLYLLHQCSSFRITHVDLLHQFSTFRIIHLDLLHQVSNFSNFPNFGMMWNGLVFRCGYMTCVLSLRHLSHACVDDERLSRSRSVRTIKSR